MKKLLAASATNATVNRKYKCPVSVTTPREKNAFRLTRAQALELAEQLLAAVRRLDRLTACAGCGVSGLKQKQR